MEKTFYRELIFKETIQLIKKFIRIFYLNFPTLFASFPSSGSHTAVLWTWLLIATGSQTQVSSVEERGVWPARHSSSETEEEMEKEGQRKKRAACAIIHVPLQQKMQSQLHKHHASTEWQRVLYTESLCSREGARDVERKQMWSDSSKERRERQRQIERSVTRTLKIGLRKQSVQIQTGSLLLS